MSLELRGFCRVANDPQLAHVGSTIKAYFNVVTEEKRKIKGEVVKTPHFLSVEAWDSAAEFILENVFRGDELYIEATPREDSREIDGEMRKRVYFRINSFRRMS